MSINLSVFNFTSTVAMRLDELLHKKVKPRWVMENKHAVEFINDFLPMLQFDRENIEHDWALLKQQYADGKAGYLANMANQS